MKPIGLLLSVITAASAMPVTIECGNAPIPERDRLELLLSGAPDADTAANLLLKHYQDHGYPAVGVEVDDLKGTRRVLVEISRFRNIWLGDGPKRTKTAATNHFRHLSGNFVNMNEVRNLLDSFHTNPLHRAVPQLQPDPDGTSVNALLRIEQSQSHRFSAGFLDTGADPLPRERLWVQGEFSDLWNFNSLSAARLTFAPDPSDFHALQVGSRLFHQSGAETSVSLSYSGAEAATFDAYTWQVGARWQSPPVTWDSWEARGNIGVLFRRSNNALEFGDTTNRGRADVVQFTLGGTLEREWEKGLTRMTTTALFSPFGDGGNNNTLRPGSAGNYEIFRTSIWHRQDLSRGWDLVANLGGQWTSDPVLQADQIALGGASGLRGLPEQFALGDNGCLGGLELRTPVWKLSENWAVRPSIFLQAGETFDEVSDTSTSAVTSGIGLQIGRSESLKASLHAGWRLDEGGSEVHSQLTWKF